ncbi:MAG: insulinase family protein [Myxococcales bacterium]|nr:insulinase family protein [Myxococcales bacterium]MDD9967268.1 insulinase family protein [Myxococcales bacterium]
MTRLHTHALIPSLTASMLGLIAGCAASMQPAPTTTPQTAGGPPGAQPAPPQAAPTAKQAPPPSGTARDLKFPPVARSTTKGGLEINTVAMTQLPTVDVKLVIRSGSAADPTRFTGMAHLVSSMLKEGTLRRSSAQIAEEVDYLGAKLWVDNDEETTTIHMRALSEHLEEALALVADLAVRPRFSATELGKLKKRELDRLALQNKNPNYLVAREFYARLYGDHPYAKIDTDEKVIKRVRNTDLKRWHRQHFAPNNAFLVVVGNVDAASVQKTSEKAFKGWFKRKVPKDAYPAPPVRTRSEVVIVDRPESVQSVIFVGNLAIPRNHPDYMPLTVANQVLGGSAASRLFMDLRERQSLTYGAYSQVYQSVGQAPFRAAAAVRNEVTAQAMAAFMDHLSRIAREPAPPAELDNAKRFLSDRFPLRIDTPAKIANLVSDLRVYDLPDDYWDKYRSEINGVDGSTALAAARKYIQADKALVVVVGKAAAVREALAKYGPVTVIDAEGNPVVVTAMAKPGPDQATKPKPASAPADKSGQAATPGDKTAKPEATKPPASKPIPASKTQPAQSAPAPAANPGTLK